MDLYQKENKKVVIYQGIVYDVEEYMPTHPGGLEYIQNELGKNIDEPFEEAEHTKSAKNIFRDLPVVGKIKSTSSDTDSTASGSDKNPNQSSLTGNISGLDGFHL